MKRHELSLANLLGDAAFHVNKPNMVKPGMRLAASLSASFQTLGVDAHPSSDGRYVVIQAPSAVAASRLHFAAVCWIVSLNYRNEGAWWAKEANRR